MNKVSFNIIIQNIINGLNCLSSRIAPRLQLHSTTKAIHFPRVQLNSWMTWCLKNTEQQIDFVIDNVWGEQEQGNVIFPTIKSISTTKSLYLLYLCLTVFVEQ